MSGIQYKCPSCAAPIEFDATLGRMRCEYCGSQFEVAEVERFNAEEYAKGGVDENRSVPEPADAHPDSAVGRTPVADRETDLSTADAGVTSLDVRDDHTDAEIAGMELLICNSCGAEIIADPTTISTRCGFCSNTFVATQRIANTKVPDFIIPFSISREAMVAAFMEATKDKPLLPKAFRDHHSIEEATGTYLPYWYHDGHASGSIELIAEDTRSWHEGNYECTEVSTFAITQQADADFRGIGVCATTKLDASRVAGVEPFNLDGAKDFATAYLSGYAASTFDIPAKDTEGVADVRIRNNLLQLAESEVAGHDRVQVKSSNLTLERTGVWLGLLPVWLLVIGYGGRTYPFAINGQTGEVVGTFPISTAKLRAWQLGTFLVGMLVAGVAAWLLFSILMGG